MRLDQSYRHVQRTAMITPALQFLQKYCATHHIVYVLAWGFDCLHAHMTLWFRIAQTDEEAGVVQHVLTAACCLLPVNTAHDKT